MSDTVPVPGRLLGRLWVAVGGTALFLGATTLQGGLRAGYDPWQQAVSALSLGPGGWIQAINFAVFGALVVSTAPTWRRILAGGRGAASYPALTAALGGALIVAGVVPQDPAPGYDPAGLALEAPTTLGLLHLAVAAVAAGCSVAGLLVMAARLAGDPAWRGWTTYSRVMALLLVVCVTVYGVWSTRPSGFAGVFERLAIVIPLVWTVTLLWRLRAGAPFMVARPRPERGGPAPHAAAPGAPAVR